ncbi:MAG TPA: di-heme oxidoredictase family protein [Candidatus Dormibacteraeota bacterium]|jgi:CxxC motif-containing protein (DUF1111 family)|nr:di-heme oxidoredictase family protein [Candidatus Dormibacteraeota bacterium]
MKTVKLASVITLATLILAGMAFAQTDPGVRGGAAGAGGHLVGLNTDEVNFFNSTLDRFKEVDSVSGTIEAGQGLGPRFNGNSCAQCHVAPAIGGSSPAVVNPQVALATLDGATNVVYPFIHNNGAIREIRLINNPNGTPDGGVHDLYTIKGRTDAPGCNAAQEDLQGQNLNGNAIARIPTAVFGLGLVELTSDSTLIANANNPNNVNFGISPKFNRSGNDGTTTRFGWKAQNKSLLIFAGEAYNVEQGVTNELFPQERDDNPTCQFNQLPEDSTNFVNTKNTASPASDFSADTVDFAGFMRFTAPPTPAPATASTTNGHNLFVSIGCALCHVENQKTVAKATFTGQSGVTYHPFSDFATHLMGDGLFDGVTQGNAGTEHFRSAPLWGVGQRAFFLHDGRTNNIVTAIQTHASNGSEANTVINNFNLLSTSQRQDIVNFLRSL